MAAWWRRWRPLLKALLALVVLGFVGLHLGRDLARLDPRELTLRPGWLLASGALYLLFLGCSAAYWYALLRAFGQRPAVPATARAYYVGQLGKYVPGKALALLMRGAMVQGRGVRLGVALVTSFYEVLTTMAAGALLAAVLFLWQPPAALDLEWDPVWLGLLLLLAVGVPLLPGVFNRLVRRASARFRQVESLQMPPLRAGTLLLGLAVTGAGWLLLGVSLWAMLAAVLPEPPGLTAGLWGRCTAVIGLAYVAGFLMVFMPGGLGAREFFLSALLVPELAVRPAEEAAAVVALVVVLLRVTWTLAELALAGVVYWFPGPPQALAATPQDPTL